MFKRIFLVLIISILFLMFSSVSYAGDDEGESGILMFILAIITAFLTIVVFVFTSLIGWIFGGTFSGLTVEKFIFNKYDLTSLRVFIEPPKASILESLEYKIFDSVTSWFRIFFVIAILLELAVLIYIAIHTAIKTFKQDPEKDSEVKLMLKDFVLGLVVLIGMAVFIVVIIALNNVLVDILAKIMGPDGSSEAITTELFYGAFDVTKSKAAVLSFILYVIIATMGIIFFAYYIKRLIKVSFLIIISPLVAVTFSIDRRKGSAVKLLQWTKMFVFTVFAQTIHALIYTALIKVVVTGIDRSTTTFIPSIVLLIAGIKFVWDAENIVKSLFGIEIEEVSKSAGFLMGAMTAMSRIKGAGKAVTAKAPQIKDKGKSVFGRFGKDSKKAELGTGKKIDDSKKKDKIKDKDRKKKKEDKKIKRELTEKDIEKAKKRAKLMERLNKVRPFKGLGRVAVDAATIKLRNMGAITFKRAVGAVGKKALKGFVKVSAASIASIASHATPAVNMFQAGLGGYAAADFAMKKIPEKITERKYDGEGRKYEKTLEKEAKQLNAIISRRKEIGEKYELSDDGKFWEDTYEDAELDHEESPDINPEDISEDGTISESKTDEYAKRIAKTSMEQLESAYLHAREKCVNEYVEKTGATVNEAKRRVELLKQALLKERDFNYDVLSAADRNLLHKFLNLVTKQKIDAFETNTKGYIEYKEVVWKANKIKEREREKEREKEREET